MNTERVLLLLDRPLGMRCLEYVLKNFSGAHKVGVVSRPSDDSQWWGSIDFKGFCQKVNIEWFEFRTDFDAIVAHFRPSVIVSVLYPRLVPAKKIENIPAYNIHCAPLPLYKGFNSTFWAILQNEVRFGPTLHEMVEDADGGPILEVSEFEIPNGCTNLELYRQTHEQAFQLFCKWYVRLIEEKPPGKAQTEAGKFYDKKTFPPREIDPHMSSVDISRFSRAFYFPPFEAAYFRVRGRKIYLIPEQI